jgi:hypothetical protein
MSVSQTPDSLVIVSDDVIRLLFAQDSKPVIVQVPATILVLTIVRLFPATV